MPSSVETHRGSASECPPQVIPEYSRGPDPGGGSYTEAVTSFLEETCSTEVSRRLTPSRSSLLSSPEERGTMLSWASAGTSQEHQHRCPSQGTGSASVLQQLPGP